MEFKLINNDLFNQDPFFYYTSQIFTYVSGTYDNNSNILSQTNALNQTTSFVYDIFNRLIKTTDNLWNIVEYKYNKNDKDIDDTDLRRDNQGNKQRNRRYLYKSKYQNKEVKENNILKKKSGKDSISTGLIFLEIIKEFEKMGDGLS